MRIALLTHHATATNLALAASAPPGTSCFVLEPAQAAVLGACDTVVGRLDVRRTLDGIEHGLTQLDRLEARGLRVLNRSLTLRLAHDKRATAGALATASLPHPRTLAFFDADDALAPPLPFPFVIKPRFGSWGRDVLLVSDRAVYVNALAILRRRAWFAATGAVVQELVPPRGHDLRLVVACGAWRRCLRDRGRRTRPRREPAAQSFRSAGGFSRMKSPSTPRLSCVRNGTGSVLGGRAHAAAASAPRSSAEE